MGITTASRSAGARVSGSGRCRRPPRLASGPLRGQPSALFLRSASSSTSPDAAAVSAAADDLRQAGDELLHRARKEPWGQTVARLQSPEGAIVGISYTPVL